MRVLPWAAAHPDLELVWRWYEVQRSLIIEEQIRLEAVLSGALEASLLVPRLNVRYRAMTGEELTRFFAEQRTRLDLMVMLELLATTEGALRIDFRERVNRRRKDSVSQVFRNLAKEYGATIKLDKHILQAWKGFNTRAKNAVSHFRGALRLRNWLAHGRCWTPKFGRTYTPNDIFDIATELLNAVGGSSSMLRHRGSISR